MKKVLSLVLSLMLVLSIMPGTMIAQAEYITESVLTGGNDFSTVFSGSGTQLTGSGYTFQNVSNSFTSMAVKEKTAVSQAISESVTSEKVLVLTPAGTANPTIRFKGFTQTAGGEPIRIKYRMYLENTSETGTYHIQALPQVGTSSSSASGGLETNDVSANQWIEVNEIVTPKSGVNVGGIKFTITKTTATNYPTTIYMDGNIVVEKVKEVTPEEILAADKDALDLGDTSAITEDISLPTVGANGSTIEWASTDTSVVDIDGTVTRELENVTVTLTATLSRTTTTSTETKTFEVTVIGTDTPADKVARDRDALDLGDLSAVTENLTLPTIGVNGSTISWASNNEAVVESNGTVHRDLDDATATLTATLSLEGAENLTKSFAVTVLGNITPAQKVAFDKAALDLGDLTAVTEDITLPTAGSERNSTIIWETSDDSVITNTGVITRGDEDATATLTATISQGTEASDTMTFTVTVKAKPKYLTIQTLTGGKDFSTVFSGFGTAQGYTMQNVSSSYTSMAAKEKSEVSQTIADGVTSQKVLVLTPSGSADPTIRFKGFSAATVNEPMRIKYRMYLENVSETGTYQIKAFPQQGTGSSSAGGELKESDVPANQWVEVSEIVTPNKGETTVQGIKFTITKTTATSWPTTVYMDGNIVVEKVKDKELFTATEKVAYDKGQLDLGDLSAVVNNLVLPLTGAEFGSVITWGTSNPDVVEIDGTVHPALETKTVTLTATIAQGTEASDTKTFEVTVLGTDTPADKIARDKAALNLGDLSAVTENLTLPTIGANGSTISWASNNEAVVGADGTVHRELDDATATLTATLSLEGAESLTKSFEVTVLGTITPEQKVAFDKEALDLGDTGAVTENLTLPATGSVRNSTITWETSDDSVITNTGVITRGTEDKTVTLTATITNGGATDTRTFTVTVIGTDTPTDKIKRDRDALDLGDLSAVTENLTLPTIGANGSTISWASNNEAVVGADGTVHRDLDDATATLTATLSLEGAENLTKPFEVTVLGNITPEQKVAFDKEALDLGDTSAVKANITLPTVGSVRNSTITWATSDASVITNKGVITRGDDDATATLTATIAQGTEATDTKTFTVTVKAKPKYLAVEELTSGNDFSTVFSGSGTQLAGGSYTLQNVSNSITSMAVEEKTAVSQAISSGVTSEKVLVLTPAGTAAPTIRFKGFSAATVGEPMRIKFRMYLENTSETGTYHIQALPQQGTGTSSASGGLEISDVSANQWIEVSEIITPTKGTTVQGIKFTITQTTATSWPTTVYMDGNIVVEKVKDKELFTATEKVAYDKGQLDLGDLSAVVNNLVLPLTGAEFGSAITWGTSDPDVVEIDGTVHPARKNKTATLTATVSLDGAEPVTKDFAVKVLGNMTPAEKVAEDRDLLDLGDLTAVEENLTLPNKGSENGSSITWETSDSSVITNTGVITRGDDDQTATLTATISLDGAEPVTKQFTVKVIAKAVTVTQWENILAADFTGWRYYGPTTTPKVEYPARFGAASSNRAEFRYGDGSNNDDQGTYPAVVYNVSKVSKDAMQEKHTGTKKDAPESANYAKIVRESNVGLMNLRLTYDQVKEVKVGDKIRVTFSIYPTDICKSGNIDGNGPVLDESETLGDLSYNFKSSYTYQTVNAEGKLIEVVSDASFEKNLTLVPNMWNKVVVEYTATKDGEGSFQIPLGYANYSSASYSTAFPSTIYIAGDVLIERGSLVEIKSPEKKVREDKASLSLGDLRVPLVENLTLPATGSINGTAITWATSDASVIEADGTIHRGEGAKTAILTATITSGEVSDTKEFTVTVAGKETAADMVQFDKAALDLGDMSAVVSDIELPAVGSVRNSAITWSTSDASVVTEDGKITRGDTNKTATLTATISQGDASDTKSFTVTILGYERITLAGIAETYFKGGEFKEIQRILFNSLFEADGSNGTNGTVKFSPLAGATAENRIYLGLVAEKTNTGINFKGWVPDSQVNSGSLLLRKTYDLPEMNNPGMPYYLQFETDSEVKGVVNYSFGNNNSDVLQIKKTDLMQQVDGVWKEVPDQEYYVFSIGGNEICRTPVSRKEVTKFGIYVIPEIKQLIVYRDGELLVSSVYNYATEEAILKTVTVDWTQTLGGSGIPATSYLQLRNMTLFEGTALSPEESVVLDKEYFRFSIATDEAFDAITKDLNLSPTAVFGTEVRWSSSDSSILDPVTGKIYPDEKLDKKVTLYAEIGPVGNSVKVEQELTILASTPRAELKGIPETYFYDNTFYQIGRIEFGESFEGGSVNADGWAPNGTNGTVYVAPITTEGASESERIPGLYAKKTDANGIWYQSLVDGAENNGQGLPIFEKTYTLPELANPGLPYYIELSAEMYIRDSLTLSFGNKDSGVVEIEKLDQNEHADRTDPDAFVVRTSNKERFEFPYTYSSDPTLSDVKIGIQVIPQLKKVLVYKDGELMYSEPLDYSKKSTVLKNLTIKWEHSTVRTTLMKENFLHLKSLAVYEGSPLPAADRLTLDGETLLLSSITDERKDQITKDLTLPTRGVYGCDITWASSDESVINSVTGAVTRQNEAKEVTLTATISVEGKSVTKSFDLLVVRKGTEGGVMTGSNVSVEKTSTIEDPSFMTDGIFETYVETLTAGAKPKITVDMGEAKLISDVIIYERMINGEYNIKKANLEISTDGKNWKKVAEIDGIGANKVVEFSPQEVRYICLTVTGLDSDKTVSLYEIEAVMSADDNSIVEADINVLKAFDSYNVTASVVLPATGKLGSTITWTTSNSDVVDITGKVTRPNGAGANVTLTATVTYGSVTKTVSFNHYVVGLTSGGAGGSGGGAGGAGGSGGGGGGGSSSNGNDKVTGQGAMNEVPADPVIPESIFSDVEKTSWAYSYIETLYTEKIMEGDGNGNFDPKRPIRREEFLKILLLALDVEIDETGDSVFSDVNGSDWYAPFVNTAYKLGLSNGMGDGSFGVGQTISRQDMAVLANRVATLKGVVLTSKEEKVLSDINSVNDYAKESVQLLANAGIISGDEYSVFNPQGKALREQAAKIICMIMELKDQADTTPVE